MFKDYLRIRPKGFQLSVFLFIWAGFYLITLLLQTLLIQNLFHIGSNEMSRFMENSIAKYPGFVIVSNALYSLLVFGLPAFLFAYLADPKPLAYLGLSRPAKSQQWIWIVLIAIGLVPLMVTLGGLVKELNLGEAAQRLQELRENQISAYLKNANGWDLFRNIIFLALLPAFCEELLFRGIIQRFAYSYWKNASGAVLISALAFSLMHMSVYDFLPIFIAGLVLAWIYQQTSCLWLNISVHFLFNGLQVFIAYYAAHNESFNQAGQNLAYLGIASIVGIIILSLALRKLYTLRNPFPKEWGMEALQEGDGGNF